MSTYTYWGGGSTKRELSLDLDENINRIKYWDLEPVQGAPSERRR